MDVELSKLFQELGLSLLLGLLVGLQRQRSDSGMAGLRTFALITVLGTLSSLLAQSLASAWIVAAGFFGVVAVLVVGNLTRARGAEQPRGTTTEVAMLVMFGVGAYLPVGNWAIAIVIGTGTAVLLQFKPELHGLAARLGDRDIRAIMQFALITGVILPILPNEAYGPLEVLNPFEVWLMVVLIVGISLGGYVVYKLWGQSAGVLIAGVLGGVVSSTATTVSYARRGAGVRDLAPVTAAVIAIASAMVYLRVMVEMAAVSRQLLIVAAGPITALFLISLLTVLAVWMHARTHRVDLPERTNPTQMRVAITFAVMYALVRFALAAVDALDIQEGLLVVAALSGLTDMDALTLSTSRMVENGLSPDTGWRVVVVGLLSNLVFKLGIVVAVGDRRLAWLVALLFAVPFAGGIALLWLWDSAWQLPALFETWIGP